MSPLLTLTSGREPLCIKAAEEEPSKVMNSTEFVIPVNVSVRIIRVGEFPPVTYIGIGKRSFNGRLFYSPKPRIPSCP